MQIALIVSEYHGFITEGLEAGARGALAEAGLVRRRDCERSPCRARSSCAQAAQRIAATRRFAAVVCLGCLIRGETPHFDYIAQAAAHGIMRAAQATGVPMAFGVLTTNTADEATGATRRRPRQQGPRGGARGRLPWRAVPATLRPAAPDGRNGR